VGDSVALDLSGATGIWGIQHPNNENVKVSINDTLVDFVWRNFSICSGRGAGMVIPVEKFARLECGNPSYRNVKFKAFIPGTQLMDSAILQLHNLPRVTFTGAAGPATVSKTAGGNPEWNFTGKYMYFDKIRFIPENCTGQNIEIAALSDPLEGKFYSNGFFYIPLSVMLAPCRYRILAVTPCNTFQLLGFVQVNP
jgi:hypothetical protein